MRHFICEITYKAPLEKIMETTEEHRAFLKGGYDKGMILLSGPQVPRVGGIVIARSESMETLDEFFLQDPYQRKGLAEYSFVEFSPKNYQDFLQDWVAE